MRIPFFSLPSYSPPPIPDIRTATDEEGLAWLEASNAYEVEYTRQFQRVIRRWDKFSLVTSSGIVGLMLRQMASAVHQRRALWATFDWGMAMIHAAIVVRCAGKLRASRGPNDLKG